jgi:hypothetical protein
VSAAAAEQMAIAAECPCGARARLGDTWCGFCRAVAQRHRGWTREQVLAESTRVAIGIALLQAQARARTADSGQATVQAGGGRVLGYARCEREGAFVELTRPGGLLPGEVDALRTQIQGDALNMAGRFTRLVVLEVTSIQEGVRLAVGRPLPAHLKKTDAA